MLLDSHRLIGFDDLTQEDFWEGAFSNLFDYFIPLHIMENLYLYIIQPFPILAFIISWNA